MKETTNYRLIKPDEIDFYDVNEFNQNADIIDNELNALNTRIDNLGFGDAIQEINLKIGVSTDAETTATLFGRIRQVYNYLTGTILTKLNSIISTQSSHTTTLSSHTTTLNNIVGYTDTVESTLSTINTNVNAANTSLTTIKTYTDNIEGTQGIHTDILNTLNSTVPKNITSTASGVPTARSLSWNFTPSISGGSSNERYYTVAAFVPHYTGNVRVVINATVTSTSNTSIYCYAFKNCGYNSNQVVLASALPTAKALLTIGSLFISGASTVTHSFTADYFEVEAGQQYMFAITTGNLSNIGTLSTTITYGMLDDDIKL